MTAYHTFNIPVDFTIGHPIPFEMMSQLATNPTAIAEGATDAPRISIDVGAQCALATIVTDTTKVLRPDGTGKVAWGNEGRVTHPHILRDGMSSGAGSGVFTGGSTFSSSGIIFSSTDGEFTVPEDGTYAISAMFKGSGDARLQKNGTTIPGLVFSPNTSVDSVTIYIQLVAGDIIRGRINAPGFSDSCHGAISMAKM